ncbi:type VII secretion integral membrane protein EccD [Rhodococcus sp. BP-349]|uniref:type VII secretion integral membrane protein EccD n=1 Tax=unclassified Rhodococcus (in: high G+C Gram-positive bacteria) TaxID=192944 RepID=UPI001C9AB861|nr:MULTISPECIES: type VII secretion integral membrane protein EccD [unclassified Rhodococcus (in: high G+C Gram-positive bacteria)]MBY6538716.1 type VII secretion integral membrane protein EccD [Rhodococcus sp. BP-363]MBY6543053.1 type VII secretion integral membrane protein EccD [Rhodococcus sp. BP-369]MBY6562283.1 type VII secretion integral membrane protein EccD [Rhodococcus sp. BP-370]MBY6576575.1 type VII secretion integral membrane protein EccD [Rhodococcus sp. BP-364]MBY6585876.1 type V
MTIAPTAAPISTTGEPAVRRIESAVLRITVIAEDVEVDVSVPGGVAVAATVPALTELIDQRTDSSRPPGPRSLSTMVGVPLEPRLSLLDNGVRDGDTVVLHRGRESSPPVFDDLTEAVAVLGDSSSWTRSDSIVAATVVSSTALAIAGWTATRTSGAPAAATLAALAMLTVMAACVCVAARLPSSLSFGLRSAGCLLAFAAGTMLVPGRDAAADAVLGFALSAAASVVTSMIAGRQGRATFTAVSTVSLVGAVASAVEALSDVPTVTIAAITAGVCTLALTRAPRLSAARAGIRLPPVPLADAGARLDHPGHEAPPTRPSDAALVAAHESALSDVGVVAERARTAQQYLTGYTTGLSLLASVGAIVVATHGIATNVDPGRLAAAGAIALVLCCRGRVGVDRLRCAVAVVTGVAAVLVVLAVGAHTRPELWQWWTGAAVAVGVLAILIGVVAPGRRFSPVARRAGELCELAVVVSIVPLVCLVVGAYSAARGL